jgi:hypothetical protein
VIPRAAPPVVYLQLKKRITANAEVVKEKAVAKS